ncbi:hypothetical protein SDC9_136631 [bioreactor metagenome]|uniref:Uncharacterized protein n=1 Tax=bioreactor metagenome TaxID=1076179 RepID=A0A645DLT8_9ZZZZ
MLNKFGMRDEDFEKLPEDEKQRLYKATASQEKVKTLLLNTLEECRKQGFTVDEVISLANYFKSEAKSRIEQIGGELF